jgi:hypothetical protein
MVDGGWCNEVVRIIMDPSRNAGLCAARRRTDAKGIVKNPSFRKKDDHRSTLGVKE